MRKETQSNKQNCYSATYFNCKKNMQRHIKSSGRRNGGDQIKGTRYLSTKRHQVHVLNERSRPNPKRHQYETKKGMTISSSHNPHQIANGQIIGEMYACQKHPNGMVSTMYLNEMEKRYDLF